MSNTIFARASHLILLMTFYGTLLGQTPRFQTGDKFPGYKGIWFTLGQFFEYGDKYSGGLGTYTAKHVPLSIYAPAVNKTFFVYGGTTGEGDRYLLCMMGCYDHQTKLLSQPTVVHDKLGVDDPHDDPSLLIDGDGYIWVFVSGRGRKRMGFKYKSKKPYSIDGFELISTEEMTYPQPWYVSGQGYFHFFTKYTGVRELYFESSTDGVNWTMDKKLSSIKGVGMEKSGHYQVSNHLGKKIGTFFNWHPNGIVDQRTNLYYLQTEDFGKTWTTAAGEQMNIPLGELDVQARVVDHFSTDEKNVYLKDIQFDTQGNPVCLYITSGGHKPGPENNPREWRVSAWSGTTWRTSIVATSDHNYDMGSLWIEGSIWTVVGPTQDGPQLHGGGGEVVQWQSKDAGLSWTKKREITGKSDRNHNYVRRVVNGKKPFQYFWADGNPDSLSISNLYFGSLKGKYWQMPYDLEDKSAKPLRMKR